MYIHMICTSTYHVMQIPIIPIPNIFGGLGKGRTVSPSEEKDSLAEPFCLAAYPYFVRSMYVCMYHVSYP